MIHFNGIIEGFVVAYRDYLWIVKGCYHPENSVIALPRYRIRCNGVEKIKNLDDAISISNNLGVLKYDLCIDRYVPKVPLDGIVRIYNPFSRYLKKVLDPNARMFVEEIASYTGMDQDDIGVTGSLLVKNMLGLDVDVRDLDIVIVTPSNKVLERIYRLFRLWRVEGITLPITGDYFVEGSIDVVSWSILVNRRVLEGIHRGRAYSVRLIRCMPAHVCVEPCHRVARIDAVIRIDETLHPYAMPYEYRAHILEIRKGIPELQGRTVIVHSLRMRFSELEVGTVLRIRGWLCSGVERFVLDLDRESTYVEVLSVSREDLLHQELR